LEVEREQTLLASAKAERMRQLARTDKRQEPVSMVFELDDQKAISVHLVYNQNKGNHCLT
jgi:hypothetical protein